MRTFLCNLASSGYTYLEFNKNFDKYRNARPNVRDGLTLEQQHINWTTCYNDYILLSGYFSDKEIKKMCNFVIMEL